MTDRQLIEVVGNMHMHTLTSDGTGTHLEVAEAALRADLDFIIYTDHNIAVDQHQGWLCEQSSQPKLLRLMGQEINDSRREPEVNHLLCYFVTEDLNHLAGNPQHLIEAIQARDGLTFLAHPLERPGIRAAKEIYPWVDWDISGFTGIELWNAMTDVKWQLRSVPRAVFGAYLPHSVLTAPFPEVIARWDALLATGQKVVAIGNSDAHAMSFSLGPLVRTVFPYEFLFRTVNTHLLLDQPLSHDVGQARRQIRQALKAGHCLICYDLIGQARGFRFIGQSGSATALMGDDLELDHALELTVTSPQPALLRLLKDGQVVSQIRGQHLHWHSHEPGVYRVEAYRTYWGRLRGWVFTNPIYVRR